MELISPDGSCNGNILLLQKQLTDIFISNFLLRAAEIRKKVDYYNIVVYQRVIFFGQAGLIFASGTAGRNPSRETRERSGDKNDGTKGQIFIRARVFEGGTKRLEITVCNQRQFTPATWPTFHQAQVLSIRLYL